MTEHTNKKRIRPLRTALICAAAVAMMVVSVAAADPDGVQEFFCNISSIIRVDQYRADMTTTEGEKVTLMNVPHAALEDRDGRAILVMDGKDVADITDDLAKDRHYVYEETTKGSKVMLTVDGTVDRWSIKTDVGTLEEDGGYNWFGGVTTTSESQSGMSAQFFDYDPDTFCGAEDPDTEVSVGIYEVGEID